MNDFSDFVMFVLLAIVVTISYKLPIYLAQATGYSSALNYLWATAKADGTGSLVVLWTGYMIVGFMLWTLPIYFIYRAYSYLTSSKGQPVQPTGQKTQAAPSAAPRRQKLEFDGGIYDGEVLDGKPHGLGTLKKPDDDFSGTGEWVKGELKGKGIATYANGIVYEGDFARGNRNGQGTLKKPNGFQLVGSWVNGEVNGKGTMTYPDGSVYEGEFVESEPHGQGTLTKPDGFQYTGEMVNGEIKGKGRATYTDGSVYEGEFVQSARQGRGTLTKPDGFQYTGEWTNNEFNGNGRASFPDGSVHEGEFVLGRRHGQGSFTKRDGLRYTGEWVNGKFKGKSGQPDGSDYESSQHGAELSAAKLDNPTKELESLIGLDQVKREINKLVLGAEYAKRRQKEGLPVDKTTLHLVFTGNPGTGKTTVARLVGQIYRDLGLLAKGHVVEVARHDLVAQYLGQTASQTTEKLKEALDGVLFIDEAYTLAPDLPYQDYGREAIDAVLVFMENNRDRISIVAAGYNNEMSKFINSNPGLKSRFTRYIDFEDYSIEECMQILEKMMGDSQYRLNPAAKEAAKTAIKSLMDSEYPHFSNGRAVRNLFEKIRERQNMRVVSENSSDLTTIEVSDVSA